MFRISLDEFEGPLDLLLFFIRRDELDIYNIPISKITSEFIGYLHAARSLNLEVAAEFIYMASMLMSIKAKMLLPRPGTDDEASDEFDPRTELVQRLLEYKRIKEASELLDRLAAQRERLFSRGMFEEFEPEVLDEFDQAVSRPTLYHLMQAYQAVLDSIPKPMTRNVMDAPVTIDQQSSLIMSKLRTGAQVSFRTVLEGITNRLIFVVTFLAVLELCRSQRIMVLVRDGHDDFWIGMKVQELTLHVTS